MARLKTRTATMNDHDAICRLLTKLDCHHAHILPDVFRTFEGPARPRDVIASFVEADDADFLLAELDGEVVGLVAIRRRARPDYPMFRPGEFVLIEDLVVDERRRRRGIGTALLEAARRWSGQRGLGSMELVVWAANSEAVDFYRKHGFGMRQYRMRLDIDE